MTAGHPGEPGPPAPGHPGEGPPHPGHQGEPGTPRPGHPGEPGPPHAGHLVSARPEPGFPIRVDGRPVTAVPGQTIGAVLYANGIRSWRTTRAGRPRGLFCGIGVCFDCLVTVNGEASLRACRTEARPGDEVTTG
ncbi:(2Fe-2S)-binding protein [Sphaerisporangium corydalis]|uniref:(2Fe-2S)-binding protein n=1 Tax=Sphaerisporangium corydalis TaxID=1441875 RepID=A0ABV9EMP7_9ACTN|nr:(2Fe-2S)-binding protein [Sphaerisporangium corydalis]